MDQICKSEKLIQNTNTGSSSGSSTKKMAKKYSIMIEVQQI